MSKKLARLSVQKLSNEPNVSQWSFYGDVTMYFSDDVTLAVVEMTDAQAKAVYQKLHEMYGGDK